MNQMIEILIAEDSPGDVRITQEALKEIGIKHRVHVAKDGEEALAFLRGDGPNRKALRPDLILLDLNMPRRNGFEVLAEVKNDANLRQIPVVVLTSSSDQRDIHKCYDSHANAYVSKPVSFEVFLKALKSLGEFWLELARLPSPAAS